MDEQRIFVGRKAELDQFQQVLEDPRGQAVLVVGQAGMGKSWLLDRMAQLAEKHPDLKCGYVRYEVTPPNGCVRMADARRLSCLPFAPRHGSIYDEFATLRLTPLETEKEERRTSMASQVRRMNSFVIV